MLVLSRQLGQSIVIDDLIVTVDWIAGDHSIVSIVRTTGQFVGNHTARFNEYFEITEKVRAIVIQAEAGKVRLGIDAPSDCRVSRWEGWNPTKA